MWVESEGIVWALGGYADLEDLKAVQGAVHYSIFWMLSIRTYFPHSDYKHFCTVQLQM